MAPLLPSAPIGALVLPEINVTSAETSRQIEKRFSFLWSSAHRLLPTSAALANHLIASMMQIARTSRAQLPQSVLDFICECCGGLLVPSVSADVRVVSQSRQSPINRRLARQQRRACKRLSSTESGRRFVCATLSTIVRVTCHRCRHSNDRPGTSAIYKAKLKKCRGEGQHLKATDPELKTKKMDTKSIDGQVEQFAPTVAKASPNCVELKSAPCSMFAAVAPSSPRKLLDGPKKRKKKQKKMTQPDAAVAAVKNDLSSFLQGLAPRT
uniref:Uncharacterized protein n=1 Tax=Peronospora matthiolae TaxID=2874970 RepID=A0AAV1SZS8_9STRA